MFAVTKNKGPRACTTCARAKSRCVPGPVANICERCHRLNKPCGSQTPAPPRRRRTDAGGVSPVQVDGAGDADASRRSRTPPTKPHQPRTSAKPARVAELERRLEDLTSRLDSVSRQQNLRMESSQSPPKTTSVPASTQNYIAGMQALQIKSPWGSYYYPTRHLFPNDYGAEKQATFPGAGAAQAKASPVPAAGNTATTRPSSEQQQQQQQQQQQPQQRPVCQVRGIVALPPADGTSPASTANSNASSASEPSSATTAATTFDLDTEGIQGYSLIPPMGIVLNRRKQCSAKGSAAPSPDGASANPVHNPPTPDLSTMSTPSSMPSPHATMPAAPPLASMPSQSDVWPKDDEADAMLLEYRTHLMPMLPFVIIPDYIDANTLRQGRPLTWKAIMMAACHLDGQRQIKLGNQLLIDLASSAFLQPRRTLDILQAVLVLLGWFNYNINSFQLVNFLYLARGLCISLGISEPAPPLLMSQTHYPRPGADKGYEQCDDEEGTCVLRQTTDYPPIMLERMRAFAGTFYLAALATTHKRPDVIMNTAYLESCLQIIERQMEYPSDHYLIQLVHVQQLSQSIAVAHSLRADGMQLGMPQDQLVQSLQQQVDTFRAQLPKEYEDNVSIMCHFHTAEILLYEVGLQESKHAALNEEPMSTTERINLLWACTQAIKRFVKVWFRDELSDRPRFLCLTSFDFMSAFLTALKLMTFRAPGWDGRRIREELDFDKLVERQIRDLNKLATRRHQHIVQVAGAAGKTTTSDPRNDPFARLSSRLIQLQSMIAKELDGLSVSSEAGNGFNNNNRGSSNSGMPPPSVRDASATPAGSQFPLAAMSTLGVSAPAADASAPMLAPSNNVDLNNVNMTDTNNAPSIDGPVPMDMSMFFSEPMLNFADSTLDFMQNPDSSGFNGAFSTPGFDTPMDTNISASVFYDAWGQMNG